MQETEATIIVSRRVSKAEVDAWRNLSISSLTEESFSIYVWLEVLGINVVTIDLPFNGFDNDVLAVSELIDSIEDDLIVLGHSYGGMVISEATQAKPNVKQLIYLSAILLKEGENVNGVTLK